jgi:hypothetical protein
MATDKERAAAAAAANSPDQAERPGQAAVGKPPKPGEDFNPGDFTPVERDRGNEYAYERESEKPTPGPGLPDDLAVSGGYAHDHTFVPQSNIDRDTGAPVQRTVCAVCGAELVDA